MRAVKFSGFGKSRLVTYSKDGEPFWCEILVSPIISEDFYGDQRITHFVVQFLKIGKEDPFGNSPLRMGVGVLTQSG
jgi:hypothetical protein